MISDIPTELRDEAEWVRADKLPDASVLDRAANHIDDLEAEAREATGDRRMVFWIAFALGTALGILIGMLIDGAAML